MLNFRIKDKFEAQPILRDKQGQMLSQERRNYKAKVLHYRYGEKADWVEIPNGEKSFYKTCVEANAAVHRFMSGRITPQSKNNVFWRTEL